MNGEEQIRRKKIWEALPDNKKKEAEQERDAIIEWFMKEENRVMNKLKAEGRFVGGLDGRYSELEEVAKEYRKKMSAFLDGIFNKDTTE